MIFIRCDLEIGGFEALLTPLEHSHKGNKILTGLFVGLQIAQTRPTGKSLGMFVEDVSDEELDEVITFCEEIDVIDYPRTVAFCFTLLHAVTAERNSRIGGSRTIH